MQTQQTTNKPKRIRRFKTPEEKKSHVAKHVEEWFNNNRKENITFGEILDKYCHIGESVEMVTNKLIELTNNQVRLIKSSVGNAIRLCIEQETTQFRIHAKFPGNPYRKHGSGRIAGKHETETITIKSGGTIKNNKQDKTDFDRIQIIEGEVTCNQCHEKHNAHVQWKLSKQKNQMIGMEIYKCKKCGAIGKCSIIYKSPLNKQMVKAQMVESKLIHGILIEKTTHVNQQKTKKETDKQLMEI